MTRKQLKTEDIERFLTCDPPSGSEFSDLSDEDTEITDESLFDNHLNINDDSLSDDLCFDQDEFERLMDEYDNDALDYQVFDKLFDQSFVVKKPNVPNIEEPSTSSDVVMKSALWCHDDQCRSRTRYKCSKCDEPVCPECMENFHTQK